MALSVLSTTVDRTCFVARSFTSTMAILPTAIRLVILSRFAFGIVAPRTAHVRLVYFIRPDEDGITNCECLAEPVSKVPNGLLSEVRITV